MPLLHLCSLLFCCSGSQSSLSQRALALFVAFPVIVSLLLPLSLPHLFELLLNLDTILCCRNDASLGDLLAILVVEDHSHGVLEVFKLLMINVLDLSVADLAVLHQRKQDISCQSPHLQVQNFGDLALLQTLVYPSDVLPESRVVVVLDAVVGSIKAKNIIN